jgi:hypothetical protein
MTRSLWYVINVFPQFLQVAVEIAYRSPIGGAVTADVWSYEKCHPMAGELTNGQPDGIIRAQMSSLVLIF